MDAKGKRRDLMDNIKSRLNSGAYNRTQYYKKNEKDLKEKVKFFEKKIATGEMRDYMMPRYEQARVLLAKLQGDEVAPAPLTLAPAPLTLAPDLAPAPLTVAPDLTANLQPKKSRKRTVKVQIAEPPINNVTKLRIKIPKARRQTARTKKPSVVYEGEPGFNPPQPNGPPKSMRRGYYNSNGTFHNEGSARISTLLPTPQVESQAQAQPSKTTRKRTIKKVEMSNSNWNHMNEASQQFLPLPELYDPFTGRKYHPDEDPHVEIERAYFMLEDIINKAKRRAKSMKAATRRKSTR